MRHFYFWMLTLFCCSTAFAQLTQDFESDITTQGWALYQTEDDDPGFVQTDLQAHGGTYSYFHDDANIAAESSSFMVSPAYTVESGDALKFWVHQNWATTTFHNYGGVWISTASGDPITNAGDFTELQEFGANFSEDTWTEVSIDLAAYEGQSVYIAFKYTGDYNDELYIDDFYVGGDCTAPTATTTVVEDCANGQFSIDVEITDLGSGSSVIVADNFGNSQTATATGTLTLGAYADASAVDITLTNGDNAVCTNSLSTVQYYCPPANDNCATATEATAFPYNMTGDATGATQEDFVVCDGNIINDGVWYSFDGASANFTVTVTPDGWDAELMIFSGTCDALVCEERADSGLSGGEESITFQGEAGTTYYVAFGHYSNTVDNLEGPYSIEILSEEIPCAVPTDLAVSGINDVQASINWTSGDGNATWDLAWGEAGFTPSTPSVDGLVAPSYDIIGLTPSTDYEVYVRANCNPGTSDWVGPVAFSTLEEGAVADGTDCAHPIDITSLPYTTTDNTSLYGNDYDGSPGNSCGSTLNYLSGDDVVYAYTPAEDTSIDISMTPDASWSAIFVYNDCANIGVSCEAGVANSGTDEKLINDFTVMAGTTYYIVISTWTPPQSTGYVLNITENTCIMPEYTLEAIGDCDNEQFSVEINATSLGSSANLSVADDQGSDTQSLTDVGVLTFGPYASGTTIEYTFTLDDSNCNGTSTLSYNCPPANDACADATMLTVGNTFDSNMVIATNLGATDSGVDAPSCASYQGGDVWFSFVAPDSGHVKVETNSNDDGITDSGMSLYSGTCDALVEVECDDDDSDDGFFSFIEQNELTAGETYYVRVWTYGNNTVGTLKVSVYDDQTCIAPEITSTTSYDCENTNTFTVTYNVTDMGSVNDVATTSFTVTDDQGGSQTIDAVGEYTFGPYATGTDVVLSTDIGDVNCNSSETFSGTCPPENDACADATMLTVGNTFDSNMVVATNVGATNSGVNTPSCASYQGGDVWFSFVAPDSGHVKVETNSNDDGITDSGMSLYSGTCDALVEVECDDDDSDDGLFSFIEQNELTAGETYYVRVWAYGNNTVGTLKVSVYDDQTCVAPELTSSTSLDCDAGTFTVTYDVTAMGSAASFTVTDDQGGSQTIDAAGEYTFGPYTTGTDVVLTIDTGDVNCNSSETFSGNCPPENDACADATTLTVGNTFDSNMVVATNVGATDSGVDAPSCANYQGGDVWFSFVAPDSGHVKVETHSNDDGITDPGMSLYSGTCDALVEVECDDDDSDDGAFSFIEQDALTAGETYYVRVWEYGNDVFGTLQVSVYDDETCVAPELTSSTSLDCDAGTFTVTYDVTAMGSAASFTVADDQGGSQTIDAVGEYTFGPYTAGTEVVLTIDTGDVNCNSSETFTGVCPPENDACADATMLTVGNTFDSNMVVATNAGATDSGVDAPGCASYQGSDVWFSFVAPDSGHVIVETKSNEGSTLSDTGLSLYSGTCDTLVEVECDDDDSDDGAFSFIEQDALTAGETYYVRVWEYGNDVFGTFQVSVYDDETCVAPEITSTTSYDCENTNTFTVTYDVTAMGSAASFTVTDDQGGSQTIDAVGEYTFGPYATGTDVVLTIDTGDVNCNSSETFSGTCPPANDACADATMLTVGESFESDVVVATNVGATDSGVGSPSCASYQGGDVWFSFVAPENGHIFVETRSNEGSALADTGLSLYSGTCDALVEMECDDDDSDDGYFSYIELEGLTAGETYYVRVWEYGNNIFDSFQISVWTSGLSTTDISLSNELKLYPNPTSGDLTISGVEVKDVKVYSLSGKMVAVKSQGATVHTAKLPTGTYVIQITDIDGNISTRKFIKK